MDDPQIASFVRSVAAGDLARRAVLALCDSIAAGHPAARAAMEQWKTLFGRACGRDLDHPTAKMSSATQSWAGGAFRGPPQTLLFALHTYYAMLIKAMLPRSAVLNDDLFSWQAPAVSPGMALPSLADYPRSPDGDLLRELYQELLPRPLRHELGEYYTPDWLAEHVLDQVGYTGDPRQRLLDPACGSGTFLLAAIRRIRAWWEMHGGSKGGQSHFRSGENWDSPQSENRDSPQSELCRMILANVAGCDINPVAVLAARANYLLALGDLLPQAGSVEPPVALCDSILDTPAGPLATPFDFIVGNPPWIAWDNLPPDYRRATQPLWEKYGLFSLSGTAARHGGGKKDLAMLMIYAAADRFLRGSENRAGDCPSFRVSENGTVPFRAPQEGDSPIFAGAKIGTVPGGRLGMVVTQTAFQTKGAGDGFRRFRLGPDGEPLKVLRVDDMAAIKPFPEAANWTATLVLEKGAATQYPVPYFKWMKEKKGTGGVLAEQNRTCGTTSSENAPRPRLSPYHAEPIESARPGSPWFLRPAGLKAELASLIGRSDYTAHLGANSGGANGVYWLEVVEQTKDGVLVRQIAGAGARGRTTLRKPSSSTPQEGHPSPAYCIEPDLLYPLLRWGDVAPYCARPSVAILLAQDVQSRTGIDLAVMQSRYPRTLAYLEQFQELLRARAAYRRYQDRKPFYSMYNIGPYTTAPVKVVWRRMDRRMRAAVIEEVDDPVLGRRPVVPQETCVLVAAASADEAHYACAVLNSAVVGFLVAAHSVGGGKGFGTPSVLDYIRLRRFDPQDSRHAELAALSRAAHEACTREQPVQAAIDRLVADLWGLDAGDRAAICAEMR